MLQAAFESGRRDYEREDNDNSLLIPAYRYHQLLLHKVVLDKRGSSMVDCFSSVSHDWSSLCVCIAPPTFLCPTTGEFSSQGPCGTR